LTSESSYFNLKIYSGIINFREGNPKYKAEDAPSTNMFSPV
jgi:hypothetical protein